VVEGAGGIDIDWTGVVTVGVSGWEDDMDCGAGMSLERERTTREDIELGICGIGGDSEVETGGRVMGDVLFPLPCQATSIR